MKNSFETIDLTGIEQAVLKDNCIIRIFCSGGGIRIVRIEDNSHKLIKQFAYPHLIPALAYASNNYEIPTKQKEYYYTKETTIPSLLNEWLPYSSNIIIQKNHYSNQLETFQAFFYFHNMPISIVETERLKDAFIALEMNLHIIESSTNEIKQESNEIDKQKVLGHN